MDGHAQTTTTPATQPPITVKTPLSRSMKSTKYRDDKWRKACNRGLHKLNWKQLTSVIHGHSFHRMTKEQQKSLCSTNSHWRKYNQWIEALKLKGTKP